MTQDNGNGHLSEDRRLVGRRFEVSEGQVRQIEREGLERKWPPL